MLISLLKKLSLSLLIACSLGFSVLAAAPFETGGDAGSPVSGQTGRGILPETDATLSDCEFYMIHVNYYAQEARKFVSERGVTSLEIGGKTFPQVEYTDILGCAIKTGEVKFWMIPFFIRYVLEFVIGLAGLLAVGFVVYGGFLYLFSGISENKDAGKIAIKNGLLGMILTIVAWGIVSIVVQLLSSF